MVTPTGAAFADNAAPYCPHGGHLESTACYNNNENTPGIYGNWTNESLNAGGANSYNGYHINDEMWGYTTADDGNFVEMGIYQGWNTNAELTDGCATYYGGEPSGPGVYYDVFWSDSYAPSPGCVTQFNHVIQENAPLGANHNYEFLYNSSDHGFDVYLDYNKVAVSTASGGSTILDHQVGLETSEPSLGSVSASTFANYPMETVAGGYWQHWPQQDVWIDDPCSQQYPTSCFNGTSYGTTDEWWDNVG